MRKPNITQLHNWTESQLAGNRKHGSPRCRPKVSIKEFMSVLMLISTKSTSDILRRINMDLLFPFTPSYGTEVSKEKKKKKIIKPLPDHSTTRLRRLIEASGTTHSIISRWGCVYAIWLKKCSTTSTFFGEYDWRLRRSHRLALPFQTKPDRLVTFRRNRSVYVSVFFSSVNKIAKKVKRPAPNLCRQLSQSIDHSTVKYLN